MMGETAKLRIERLRKEAVKPEIGYGRFYLDFYEKFSSADPALPLEERYAAAYVPAFDALEPEIGEDELIVGRATAVLDEADRQREREAFEKASALFETGGQDSHMTVDYPLLLREGIHGILKRIEDLSKDADEAKLRFYGSCRECLQAVVRFSQRYAQLAKRMAAECEEPRRRKDLERIAEICARVPAEPAASFREAVQSVHFLTFCLSINPFRPTAGGQQFQLGRPDRYLEPYYEADLKAGRITADEAQELIDCLAVMINRRVISGLSSGYMVGGRDADGRTVANDLTRMGIRAVEDVRLVYPAVGLCWTPEMPEDIMDLACETLSHGRSHPAIFNDDLISQSLREYGVSDAESHEYIHSTCVEITPVAASNNWVASPYTNLAQLLLDAMDREYPSLDALTDAVLERLAEKIRVHFEEQNALRLSRAKTSVNPLLSCFVNDCLARGTDIERGGARYNWIMPSFVGMANLIDSLYAVGKVVFEEKRLKLTELRQILDRNFEGEEALRLRLLNTIDKYGNDVDEVDAYAPRITQFIVAECRKYTPVFSGGRLTPSVFCWVMHERFGRQTGATPDGRPSGFPLGDGSGPCQGRERCGPTASILSSTKWSHKELIGGVAVNMKFAKKIFTEDSASRMKALIRTYLERGGFEMQINVVDRDTLLEAQRDPERYEDLVVRIGGYSDYFVRLSRQMQEEVLLRTEHGI